MSRRFGDGLKKAFGPVGRNVYAQKDNYTIVEESRRLSKEL
jgi:hypothetical protein